MPRIHNLGDLDWNFNPSREFGHYGPYEHIYLRMIFDSSVNHTREPELEVVTFAGDTASGCSKGENVLLSGSICEEATKMIPSVARELGRFMAMTLPSVYMVSVVYHCDYRGVGYVVNQLCPVEYPTKFITSLANKINTWEKESGLDLGIIPVLYPETLLNRKSKELVYCWQGVDPEIAERFVLKLRKLTGQKVEWWSVGHGSGKQHRFLKSTNGNGLGYLYTDGDRKVVKRAITQIARNFDPNLIDS